jgi:imidazole glycerol phosphate synthase glutamine amidotransferase subunit
MTEVRVVRTGVANLASVQAALQRVGARPDLCADPDRLRTADRVVLPGVGAFGAAMDELRRLGVADALRERILQGRPTLAVCLGLQLFARESEETPGVAGLGVIDAAVTRFPRQAGLRVPQMGWNAVTPQPGSRFLVPGHAYYANTYKLDALPDGWTGGLSEHGGSFVAALERGDVLACQFHPELSGPWGAALLSRWIRGEAAC